MNSISLSMGNGMQEEVSGARFATLENEVKHITSDVSEIKGSVKTTEKAIISNEKAMISIGASLDLLAKSVEQNKTLGPRIHNLETKVSKIELKIAAYAGGVAAIVFVFNKFDKIAAFFA